MMETTSPSSSRNPERSALQLGREAAEVGARRRATPPTTGGGSLPGPASARAARRATPRRRPGTYGVEGLSPRSRSGASAAAASATAAPTTSPRHRPVEAERIGRRERQRRDRAQHEPLGSPTGGEAPKPGASSAVTPSPKRPGRIVRLGHLQSGWSPTASKRGGDCPRAGESCGSVDGWSPSLPSVVGALRRDGRPTRIRRRMGRVSGRDGRASPPGDDSVTAPWRRCAARRRNVVGRAYGRLLGRGECRGRWVYAGLAEPSLPLGRRRATWEALDALLELPRGRTGASSAAVASTCAGSPSLTRRRAARRDRARQAHALDRPRRDVGRSRPGRMAGRASLAWHPSVPGRAYRRAAGARRSADWGVTWRPPTTDVTALTWSVAADPLDPRPGSSRRAPARSCAGGAPQRSRRRVSAVAGARGP